MQDSTTLPERIYGLAVAGPHTVRPNESIRLCFRVRNAPAAPSPAGRAIFAIPPGWTALDPIEAEVPPLAAGCEHTLALRLRAGSADDAGTSAFQVALVLPQGTLGSNVVRVAVRGRPRFACASSTLCVEPGPMPDEIRAVAALVNEGDAVARAVRIVVPPPPGFRAVDETAFAAGDVAPGERVACSIAFRAHAPSADAVAIDDAFVAFDGGTAPLACAAPLRLAPELLPPVFCLARRATRLDVAIRLANRGLVPARDVTAEIIAPAGWSVLRGTLTLDGAPVNVSARGATLVAQVPLLAARGAIELRFIAAARAPRLGGTLRVAFGGHDVAEAIPPALRRSVRVDPRCERATVRSGVSFEANVAVWNDGETDEEVIVRAGGEDVARLTLRAGRGAHATVALTVPEDDDPDVTVAVAALGSDGDVLGTGELQLRRAPALAPSEPAPDPAPPSQVDIAWDVPGRSIAGIPLAVTMCCRFASAVADCRVRACAPAARYVAGSTRVNGFAVLDGPGEPPLFAPGGLQLHDVPAGAEVALGWSLVADGSAAVALAAALELDGVACASAGPTVAIEAVAPFAVRPDGLPFHIAAPTVAAPAAAPVATAIAFGLRLDAARRITIARMLRGMRGGTIVAHLPLIAALFPEVAGSNDPQIADALALAGELVRGIYERLFVKLRIPGYDVGPYDLEDAPLRSALVALLDGTADAPAVPLTAVDSQGTLDATALRDGRARLARAPLGGVDAVAAAALFLPRTGSDPAARALAAYAGLVVRELEAARPLTHDAFGAYLTMHAVDALEDARVTAIAALDPDPFPRVESA